MAGLALGAKLFLPGTTVHGMMVDTDPFDEITPALMRETAALPETYYLAQLESCRTFWTQSRSSS